MTFCVHSRGTGVKAIECCGQEHSQFDILENLPQLWLHIAFCAQLWEHRFVKLCPRQEVTKAWILVFG
jgi:hypothetical protein